MGEIHPDVAENFGIGTRACVAELFFDLIVELSEKEIQYHQPPRYPSTSRDVALIVDEDLQVGDIEKTIREAGTELLRDVKLFDVYKGAQIEAGKKSVAFNIVLRSSDSTLTDEQTNRVMKKVMEELEKVGAVLRS